MYVLNQGLFSDFKVKTADMFIKTSFVEILIKLIFQLSFGHWQNYLNFLLLNLLEMFTNWTNLVLINS